MVVDAVTPAIAVRDALLAGPTRFHQVLARFIERALQAHRSVVLLEHHGLAGDAMSVCRTIVELAIDAAYILSDKDQRDVRLAKFEAFEDVTDAAFLSEFKDEDIVSSAAVAEANSIAAIKKQKHDIKNSNNWDSTAKARSSALASLMGVEIYASYRDGCRAGHSGPVTLRYAIATDDEPPPTNDARALADLYLGALVRLIDDALGLGVPHTLPPFPWNEG